MKAFVSILALLVLVGLADAGHYGASAQQSYFYSRQAQSLAALADPGCGCSGPVAPPTVAPTAPPVTFAPQTAPASCSQSQQQQFAPQMGYVQQSFRQFAPQASYAQQVNYAQQAQFAPAFATNYAVQQQFAVQPGFVGYAGASNVFVGRGLIGRGLLGRGLFRPRVVVATPGAAVVVRPGLLPFRTPVRDLLFGRR